MGHGMPMKHELPPTSSAAAPPFEEFAGARDDDAGIAGWTPWAGNAPLATSAHWPGVERGSVWWISAAVPAPTRACWLKRVRGGCGIDYSLPSLAKARARSAATNPWCAADVNRCREAWGCRRGAVLRRAAGHQCHRAGAPFHRRRSSPAACGMDISMPNASPNPGTAAPHARRQAHPLRYETARAVRRLGTCRLRGCLYWCPSCRRVCAPAMVGGDRSGAARLAHAAVAHHARLPLGAGERAQGIVMSRSPAAWWYWAAPSPVGGWRARASVGVKPYVEAAAPTWPTSRLLESRVLPRPTTRPCA